MKHSKRSKILLAGTIAAYCLIGIEIIIMIIMIIMVYLDKTACRLSLQFNKLMFKMYFKDNSNITFLFDYIKIIIFVFLILAYICYFLKYVCHFWGIQYDIIKREKDLILTREGKLVVWLHKNFPNLTDRIILYEMAKEQDSPF